jgi:S1-C subfamily serine protease
MPVRICCPSCKKTYDVADEVRGKRILCRNCSKPIMIPAAPAAAAPVPAPAAPADATYAVKEPVHTAPRPEPMPVVAVQPARQKPKVAVVAEAVESGPPRKKAKPAPSPEPESKGGGLLVWLAGVMLVGIFIVGTLAAIGVGIAIYFSRTETVVVDGDKPGAKGPDNLRPLPDNGGGQQNDDGGQKKQPGPGGQLPADVVAKVKNATTYMRVTRPNGVSQGSGFFAFEQGLVLTNAHVLGMLRPDQDAPLQIEVVVNSGEPNSRSFAGKILGVDRDSDLAVVRVDGAGLPQPLDVKPSAGLQLTQAVYVFGFPFGEQLGKDVTVSQTSVSSLRRGPDGELAQVQVNGGMHPGNSGGPVVNSDGDVVGVTVAGIPGTQINFAVAGEAVHRLINGRLAGVAMGHSFKDAGGNKVRFRVDILDPLQRVQRLSMTYWIGSTSLPRAPSAGPAPEVPGDSPHQQLELRSQGGTAVTDLALPPLQPDQALWVQASMVNGGGQNQWTVATSFKPWSPLENEPVLLSLRPLWGVRALFVNSKNMISINEIGAPPKNFDVNMVTTMVETTTAVNKQNKQDKISLALYYRRYEVGMPTKEMTPGLNARIKGAVPHIAKLNASLVVDQRNHVEQNIADVSKAPKEYQADLDQLHSQIQDSLEMLLVPLPGRVVMPGDQWKAARPVFVFTGERGDLAPMVVTYTYQGTEIRAERKEAVIGIEGVAAGNLGQSVHVRGRVSGKARFDVQTNQFAAAEVTAKIELEKEGKGKMVATLVSSLERTIGTEILNVKGQLTQQHKQDSSNHYYAPHAVQLEQGQKYIIGVESTRDGPGQFDTKLVLADDQGKAMYETSNKVTGPTAMLMLGPGMEFVPRTTGKYVVIVTTHAPNTTGNYIVVARKL